MEENSGIAYTGLAKLEIQRNSVYRTRKIVVPNSANMLYAL
jgi:hypothetical protein